jgi:hypothetical protein
MRKKTRNSYNGWVCASLPNHTCKMISKPHILMLPLFGRMKKTLNKWPTWKDNAEPRQTSLYAGTHCLIPTCNVNSHWWSFHNRSIVTHQCCHTPFCCTLQIYWWWHCGHNLASLYTIFMIGASSMAPPYPRQSSFLTPTNSNLGRTNEKYFNNWSPRQGRSKMVSDPQTSLTYG